MRRLAAALLALALIATACGGDDDDDASGEGNGDEASSDAIQFGFLNGQSGDYGPWGEWALAAAEIAIEEINAAGGVLGRDAELIVEDNKSTPEGAVAGFSKLTEVDNILALSGIESDGMMAIFDSVHEQEIPTVCDTCGTTELDERGGEYAFRIISSDSDTGLAAAQWARDEGFTRVGMLVEQTEGTVSPAEVFKEVWEGPAGGELTADVRIDPGGTSYSAAVAEVFEGSPEAVYMAVGFDTGVAVLEEWSRRGYGGTLILVTDLVHEDIAAIVGDAGVAVSTAYDEESEAFQAYAPRFEERIGEPSESGKFDVWRYDAYILLALAMQAAGTTDGAAVAAKVQEVASPPGKEVFTYADALAELEAGNDIDYHGVTSNLDLNDNGNLESPTQAEFRVQDGAWVPGSTFDIDPALRE